MKRWEYLQTHYIGPTLPWYQNLTKTPKVKKTPQTSIPDKHCDTMKYIFGLHSNFQHRTLKKPLNFLTDEWYKGVFCYITEVNFGPDLKIGAICQENQPCD